MVMESLPLTLIITAVQNFLFRNINLKGKAVVEYFFLGGGMPPVTEI